MNKGNDVFIPHEEWWLYNALSYSSVTFYKVLLSWRILLNSIEVLGHFETIVVSSNESIFQFGIYIKKNLSATMVKLSNRK